MSVTGMRSWVRGPYVSGVQQLEGPECTCLVCAIASKHQSGLAGDRTKDLGLGCLSSCDPGLDTEETRGCQSWLLEEPGGPQEDHEKTMVSRAWLPVRP